MPSHRVGVLVFCMSRDTVLAPGRYHLPKLDVQNKDEEEYQGTDTGVRETYTYGAYLRIIASTLILRAARRYFSDSSRSEDDIEDMSVVSA